MPIPELTGVPVLVTGGAGFIGSHLVDALVGRGARVVVLDNLATGRVGNLAHLLGAEALAATQTGGPMPRVVAGCDLTLLLGDIRDAATCRAACGLEAAGEQRLPAPAYVFHQAALGSVPRSMKDPATSLAVNVGGTANVFAAARDAGVKRVVYASSSSVYGDSPRLPKREGEEGKPLSPYALSKVMDEELADIFGRCFGMELVGLRYFNVFGPRQDPNGPYAAVIPRFFAASTRGEAPVVYGDGEQSRDFTFVENVVEANLLAADAAAEACGRAYNVAAGLQTSVNELARRIAEACGGGPEPVHEAPRAGDVRDSLADLSLVRAALGYEARVDLAEGLRRTKVEYLPM
ncbi:MAG: NAD-dependent epimerase/dehydratase family protein [Thermoanaerobaculaceae bacterium]|nr:NAD-dependent epimerase/dehydratase family protein [Thermoanaerobaculaceae bacterium]